jgi:hypothetical protein
MSPLHEGFFESARTERDGFMIFAVPIADVEEVGPVVVRIYVGEGPKIMQSIVPDGYSYQQVHVLAWDQNNDQAIVAVL